MTRWQTGFLIFRHRRPTHMQSRLSFLSSDPPIHDSTRQVFPSDSTIAPDCWNMSRTSPSRIQLRLFFTATPQEEHAHPSSRAFLTHPSPLHPLCHTHKEISDCTAFPLSPLGIHVLLIYTSKRCSQLLRNIPNSLAQTRRKCNWHTRHGALTGPRALVCFGVSSMIFFGGGISFRSVVPIHQTNLIMSKDKKEICQSRHD